DECVEAVYRHTPQPFRLWIMDLDYPASVIAPVRGRLQGRPEVRFFDLGLRTPMDALREVQPLVDTPAVVLLDNDSRVTEGWLAPLLGALGDGHAVVSPLILEREGVDRGAPLRNHLYTGELRVVDVATPPTFSNASTSAAPKSRISRSAGARRAPSNCTACCSTATCSGASTCRRW